jgi:chromosomal replication initiator protein
MDGLEPRLQSRLSGGLVAAIQTFDEKLRREVLARKCAGMKRDVPAEVIDLLATRITASLRELDGALGRLIAHAELTGRALTLESAQDLLEDVLRSSEKRVGAEDIQKAVAEYYGLRMADILSPRRARAVARPRQLAMYLCKAITTLSLPDIGRKFSGRDHTTIIHGVRKIEELLETDNQLQSDVVAIKRALGV